MCVQPSPSADLLSLPTPQLVALNHLYCTAIKDGMMVLGATQRYREKFVTVVFYSMMPSATSTSAPSASAAAAMMQQSHHHHSHGHLSSRWSGSAMSELLCCRRGRYHCRCSFVIVIVVVVVDVIHVVAVVIVEPDAEAAVHHLLLISLWSRFTNSLSRLLWFTLIPSLVDRHSALCHCHCLCIISWQLMLLFRYFSLCLILFAHHHVVITSDTVLDDVNLLNYDNEYMKYANHLLVVGTALIHFAIVTITTCY